MGQPATSCRQRTAGVAIAGALESARRVAGGSNLCTASGASRIRGLDHGTKKCADGLFLSANASCLGCVCRRADETAMVLLCVGFDPLRAGSFVQNNGLHAASGAVPDFVVTEKADQLAKNYSDRPVFPSWAGDGLDHSLVGTIPSGHARSALCPQSDRARPHRQSRGLVLFGQTHLAIQSDLHLSAMGYRADSSARLHVAVGGNGSLRGNLFSAAICGAQRRNRNAVFRSHA